MTSGSPEIVLAKSYRVREWFIIIDAPGGGSTSFHSARRGKALSNIFHLDLPPGVHASGGIEGSRLRTEAGGSHTSFV